MKVTTTIRPDETFEADEREVADLHALGVLKSVDGKPVPKADRNIEQTSSDVEKGK